MSETTKLSVLVNSVHDPVDLWISSNGRMGKWSFQVLSQSLSLFFFLDGSQDLCVNCSLIFLSLLTWLVSLLLGVKNISLLLSCLLGLDSGK